MVCHETGTDCFRMPALPHPLQRGQRLRRGGAGERERRERLGRGRHRDGQAACTDPAVAEAREQRGGGAMGQAEQQVAAGAP